MGTDCAKVLWREGAQGTEEASGRWGQGCSPQGGVELDSKIKGKIQRCICNGEQIKMCFTKIPEVAIPQQLYVFVLAVSSAWDTLLPGFSEAELFSSFRVLPNLPNPKELPLHALSLSIPLFFRARSQSEIALIISLHVYSCSLLSLRKLEKMLYMGRNSFCLSDYCIIALTWYWHIVSPQ